MSLQGQGPKPCRCARLGEAPEATAPKVVGPVRVVRAKAVAGEDDGVTIKVHILRTGQTDGEWATVKSDPACFVCQLLARRDIGGQVRTNGWRAVPDIGQEVVSGFVRARARGRHDVRRQRPLRRPLGRG